MANEGKFDGKLALVTGASKGIGAATARALAAEGAQVILVARDVKALEAVEDEIHDAGGSATIAPLDLSEGESIGRLSAAIAGRWDTLDYLILNAAYLPHLSPVTQIDGKQYTKALMTNVVATQALLASLDPMLKRAESARIIGLTSSVGADPRAFWSAYGSTKAAFDNLLSSYAQETEKLGDIKVAILDPGATRTDMRARAYPGEDPETVKPPEAVADRIVALLSEDFPNQHRERVQK
ncbi:SDR family NAD(P)-dependent oxidoreductase [Altererythrobacter lutimaris]|uniref:SDR family NAD(P)-dependent oxidoreductase n=1 Tax=Altererythrobacter lutimaris TaxID=2743979 RepID=A0A850HAH1_9SPHN|nr:SDR family NAD(P)-dependent oxidoreductase [Altererythrobacter lutimaris]NVE93896.1 SDR family NAD(P)-dependent oxidoreductase [Altererythrobacter lutimaris]